MIKSLFFLLLLCLGVGYIFGVRLNFDAFKDSSKSFVVMPQENPEEPKKREKMTLLRGTKAKVKSIKTRSAKTLDGSKQRVEVIK